MRMTRNREPISLETRASYLIVGIFVILGMAGMVVAAMWITGSRTDRQTVLYDIYFEGSVAGLKPGNTVQYRGIPVGGVTDMRIDPESVERVLVTIEVAAGTPIREDTEATLAIQGITGLSYIQLTGGTQQAAPLTAAPGADRPVIRSRRSDLGSLLEAAPELLNRAIAVVARLEEFLSAENQRRITNILGNVEAASGALSGSVTDIDRLLADGADTVENLKDFSAVLAENSANVDTLLSDGAATVANVKTVTATLAESSDDIRAVLDDGAATMANVRVLSDGLAGSSDDIAAILAEGARTMEELRRMTSRANGLLENIEGDVGGVARDTRAVLGSVRNTVAELEVAAAQFTRLLSENREPWSDFSQTGLYEFSQLMSEARVLVAALSRLTEQIERDPARFLFGDRQQGVEVE